MQNFYVPYVFIYYMESSVSSYVNFPVHETIDIKDISDIHAAVDRMMQAYIQLEEHRKFSYRLLLPRGEKLTTEAKKLGLIIQAEFLLALKKKKLKPHVKEIRYTHDKNHYGWIFANPETLEPAGTWNR